MLPVCPVRAFGFHFKGDGTSFYPELGVSPKYCGIKCLKPPHDWIFFVLGSCDAQGFIATYIEKCTGVCGSVVRCDVDLGADWLKNIAPHTPVARVCDVSACSWLNLLVQLSHFVVKRLKNRFFHSQITSWDEEMYEWKLMQILKMP